MNVAVLGQGTVGVGVYEMLQHADGLSAGPVLVRAGKADAPYKVESMNQIAGDPHVDAVVEVLGGIHPALEYVSQALQAGKHVVTANKALVAAHGVQLAALARQSGAAFLFSAACGGGVPFLHNLALTTHSDAVLSVGGILNGTTNYMLDAMQRRGLTYAQALADAQQLGYAEADPTADVSGLDALRKIMLACAVAFRVLPEDGLCCEGIERLTAQDVSDLQSLGITCRLLARGGAGSGGVFAYVEPALLPATAAECTVLDNYNLARYEARNAGSIVLMGQGAGRYPTASAVLRDLSCVGMGQREMLPVDCVCAAADNSQCGHPYYVRLPEELAERLPARRIRRENGVARVITQALPVAEMHQLASQLRQSGAEIFFAGIEESVC